MDSKRFLTGTVVGGIVIFGLGYLVYGMALKSFYDANMGTATGVSREAPLLWAVAVGSFCQAAFLTLVIGWSGASTAAAGFRIGAMTGLLVAASVDFIMYGTSNVSNMTLTIVDPLITLIVVGLLGAVIAAVAGRKPAAG